MFERSLQVPSLSNSTSQPYPKTSLPKHKHIFNGLKTILNINIIYYLNIYNYVLVVFR